MSVTHWRDSTGRKILIADMTELYKENVAKMVCSKYGFRNKADGETLQDYLGQLLLWLEISQWCKANSENYCQY